ncbi:uncharacterized protein LOC135337544 isoform X2 [Halichondria panicea]|uniref:uncharacterized protein LOC135337544 isoform X2 n=1 Tax=Halichondria panicea TaxID=6063 RepID=UPI00312B847B
MLSPTCTSTGDVVGEEHNCVVPREVLCEVLLLKRNGMTMEDIVSRLRCRTVPSGYPIHSWRTLSDGESESLDDKLRSILAQMEFTHVVRSWDQKGVPFRTYIYVPEEHPELGTVFHEREDEGHVYKRMRNSTLMGGPKRFKLERFNEAVYDESANLTYTALIGRRKQSIRDVENFFSSSVANFMNRKGYTYEAQFVTTVRNWRRACDERGLTQLKRCQFNYELLNMLLDELMPWHRTQYDLSLMEVNRYVVDTYVTGSGKTRLLEQNLVLSYS